MLRFLAKAMILLLPRRSMQAVRDLLSQLSNCRTLAKRYGQLRSIKERSCLDRMGQAIPWYTYPAIEYLSHIDFAQLSILEYGSGNSSLWWLQRCRELISIENDPEWYKTIQSLARTGRNFCYILETTEEAYVQQERLSTVNIVIIDGVYRSKCADALIAACRDKSCEVVMLIFDNSDWYPNSIRRLHDELDWVQVDFHGFGPINSYTWTTSIFINPQRARKLKYAKPISSIAWIDNATGNTDDDACV